MGKQYLTSTETIGIGCVVFMVAFVLIGIWFGFDMYFLMALPAFVIAMFPSIAAGVLIGKYLTKTCLGTLLGAVLGAIIGYFLFFSLVSKMSFD